MSTIERLPCGPAADDGDRSFWEALRGGELRLPRCSACGTWREPGRSLCANCWSWTSDWQPVPAEGRVYTWIRSRRAFMSELDVEAPYVTVLVELTHAPVRLLGILTNPPEGRDPATGDAVVGVIEEPANADWPVLRWRLDGSAA